MSKPTHGAGKQALGRAGAGWGGAAPSSAPALSAPASRGRKPGPEQQERVGLRAEAEPTWATLSPAAGFPIHCATPSDGSPLPTAGAAGSPPRPQPLALRGGESAPAGGSSPFPEPRGQHRPSGRPGGGATRPGLSREAFLPRGRGSGVRTTGTRDPRDTAAPHASVSGALPAQPRARASRGEAVGAPRGPPPACPSAPCGKDPGPGEPAHPRPAAAPYPPRFCSRLCFPAADPGSASRRAGPPRLPPGAPSHAPPRPCRAPPHPPGAPTVQSAPAHPGAPPLQPGPAP